MSSQHFLAVFYFLFIYTSLFGQAIDHTLSPHDELFINSVTLRCQEKLTPLQNTNFRIIYELERIKIAFADKEISSPTKNSTNDYWFFFHFIQMPLDLQKRIYIFIAPQTNYILTFENIETDPLHLAFQYNDNYRIHPSFPLKLGITNIQCACFINKTRIRKRHTIECTKTTLSKPIFPISHTLLKPDIRWTPSYEYENKCPDESIINGYYGRTWLSNLLINPFINETIQSKDTIFYLNKKYENLLTMDFLNDPENKEKQSKTFAFQYPLISAHMLQLNKILIECINEPTYIYIDEQRSQVHDKDQPIPRNHLLAVYSIPMLKNLESNNTNNPISISLKQALYTYRLPINSNCSNDYTLGDQDGPEVCNVAFTHNQKIYLEQKNDFERFFVFNILERDNIDLIISLAHNNKKRENHLQTQNNQLDQSTKTHNKTYNKPTQENSIVQAPKQEYYPEAVQDSSILPTLSLMKNSFIMQKLKNKKLIFIGLPHSTKSLSKYIMNQESYTILKNSHYKNYKKNSDFSFSCEKASYVYDFAFLQKTSLPFILNRFLDANNPTILTMDLMKSICEIVNKIVDAQPDTQKKHYTARKLSTLLFNTIKNLVQSKDINNYITNQEFFIATIKLIASLSNISPEELETIAKLERKAPINAIPIDAKKAPNILKMDLIKSICEAVNEMTNIRTSGVKKYYTGRKLRNLLFNTIKNLAQSKDINNFIIHQEFFIATIKPIATLYNISPEELETIAELERKAPINAIPIDAKKAPNILKMDLMENIYEAVNEIIDTQTKGGEKYCTGRKLSNLLINTIDNLVQSKDIDDFRTNHKFFIPTIEMIATLYNISLERLETIVELKDPINRIPIDATLTMDLIKSICETVNEIIETQTSSVEKYYTARKLGNILLNTIKKLLQSKDIDDFRTNQELFIATINFIASLYNVSPKRLETINPISISIESKNKIINQNQKIYNFQLYFQTPNKSLIKFEEVDQPEDITKLNKNEIELNKAIQNAFINVEKLLTIIFDKELDKSMADYQQKIITYIKQFLLIPHFEQDNFSSLEKAMEQSYSDDKNIIEIILPLQLRDFLLISSDTDTNENYNKKIRGIIHNVFKFFSHIGSSKHIPDAIKKHGLQENKNENYNKKIRGIIHNVFKFFSHIGSSKHIPDAIKKDGLQENKNEISSALLYELKKYNKLWLKLLANAVKERRAIWENKSVEHYASNYTAESLQQGTQMQTNKPSQSNESENKSVEHYASNYIAKPLQRGTKMQTNRPSQSNESENTNVKKSASCYSEKFFLLRFIFFIARSIKYISSIFFFNRLYSNSIFNLLCQLF